MAITVSNSSRRKNSVVSSTDIQRWNSLIASLVKSRKWRGVVFLLHEMQQEGFDPDGITYLSVLKACGRLRDVQLGRLMHERVIEGVLDSTLALGNALIDMHGKCGFIIDARAVFNALPSRDVVSWGAIITGYVDNGQDTFALDLFAEMQDAGIKPDIFILPSILKACTATAALDSGRLIHEQVMKDRQESDVIIGSALVDLYAKCGRLRDARNVFDGLPKRDAILWGTLLAGYALFGLSFQTMELYEKMQLEGIKPSQVMFLSALKACSSLSALRHGRCIHSQIIVAKLETDAALGSSMVDMYGRCGSMLEAHRVFVKFPNKNMVTWGALLAGLIQQGHDLAAFELYEKMQQDGIKPDNFIFTSILKVCGNMHAMEQGRIIHDRMIRMGLEKDIAVSNTLIDLYSKCGRVEEARKLFDNVENKNIVAWGAIISGFMQQGFSFIALKYFEEMQRQGISASETLFLCVLKACSNTGSIVQGRFMHDRMVRLAIDTDLLIGNDLIDMYAKCGSLEEAMKVFHVLPNRTLVSWGAIIEGCAQTGNHGLVMKFFEEMQKHCLKPDGVIFTSILTACSHAGLVEEGHCYFESMTKLGVTPRREQYNCMVDLLSRMGSVRRAGDLLQSMPFAPDTIGWRSLLSGCKLYGDLELGEHCFQQISHLDTRDSASFVLMSDMYEDLHMFEHADELQYLRKGSGALKQAGFAWIEVNCEVHEFIVGGLRHSEVDELYVKLQYVRRMVKTEGYSPSLGTIVEPFFFDGIKEGLTSFCEKVKKGESFSLDS